MTSVAFMIGAANAESMIFSIGSEYQRCGDPGCSGWINATGEITRDTPAIFQKFLDSTPNRPKSIRFNSPGGDLIASLALGQKIRREQLNTEADICMSACAYAFLGGVQRTFVGQPTVFGVHRFYRSKAALNPSLKQFTGIDLDETQQAMAGLMLYALDMGVDLRILTLAAEAGSEEMRLLTEREAKELNVIYDPNRWSPWQMLPLHGGIVAVSQTDDGQAFMQISCSAEQGGGVFTLVDRTGDRPWLQQCAGLGPHPILGLVVNNAQYQTTNEDTPVINFYLGDSKPSFDHASVFRDTSFYPMACISQFDRYAGTTKDLKVTGELALRNCLK